MRNNGGKIPKTNSNSEFIDNSLINNNIWVVSVEALRRDKRANGIFFIFFDAGQTRNSFAMLRLRDFDFIREGKFRLIVNRLRRDSCINEQEAPPRHLHDTFPSRSRFPCIKTHFTIKHFSC